MLWWKTSCSCIYKFPLPKKLLQQDISQSSYLWVCVLLICIGKSLNLDFWSEDSQIKSHHFRWNAVHMHIYTLSLCVHAGLMTRGGARARAPVNIVKSSNRKTQYREQKHEDRLSTANGKTNRTNGNENARDFANREHNSFRILYIRHRTQNPFTSKLYHSRFYFILFQLLRYITNVCVCLWVCVCWVWLNEIERKEFSPSLILHISILFDYIWCDEFNARKAHHTHDMTCKSLPTNWNTDGKIMENNVESGYTHTHSHLFLPDFNFEKC